MASLGLTNYVKMLRRCILPIVPLGNGIRLSNCFNSAAYKAKHYCTSSNKNNNKMVEPIGSGGMTRDEAYRQLENLDFMTATKILFTAPPKRKKFGLDFHLVQLFFACLPPLAVYLVAQYARSEMRKMDVELHQKKKQAEEEEKAREAEKIKKEEEVISEIANVKNRLDVLEVTVKEIASDTKKISQSNVSKGPEAGRKEPVYIDDKVNKKDTLSSEESINHVKKSNQDRNGSSSYRDIKSSAPKDHGMVARTPVEASASKQNIDSHDN